MVTRDITRVNKIKKVWKKERIHIKKAWENKSLKESLGRRNHRKKTNRNHTKEKEIRGRKKA